MRCSRGLFAYAYHHKAKALGGGALPMAMHLWWMPLGFVNRGQKSYEWYFEMPIP